MPSHPDRVRRNYHDIHIEKYEIPAANEQVIYIKITRRQIASAMTKEEIEYSVLRSIHLGIFEQYRD